MQAAAHGISKPDVRDAGLSSGTDMQADAHVISKLDVQFSGLSSGLIIYAVNIISLSCADGAGRGLHGRPLPEVPPPKGRRDDPSSPRDSPAPPGCAAGRIKQTKEVPYALSSFIFHYTVFFVRCVCFRQPVPVSCRSSVVVTEPRVTGTVVN